MLLQFPVATQSTITAINLTEARLTSKQSERYITAAIVDDRLIYQLLEREAHSDTLAQFRKNTASDVVMESFSGLEIVSAAYLLIEEEQLAEKLTPFFDHAHSENGALEADVQPVAQVEEIVEADRLSRSQRAVAREDICEFLEGRLEASLFINRAIERQRLRLSEVERHSQRYALSLSTS